MWEYQIKPDRPVNPKESSDIHPVRKAVDVAAQHQVNQHEEGNPGYSSKTGLRAENEVREINCPVCHKQMNKVYLGKIEIDKCPKCQGVFLDKGELETISKHSLSSYTPSAAKTSNKGSSSSQQDFLIYTPHGLTNHVMEHD